MTTPTDRFAFPKPVDTDPADLPTQMGNVIEQIEDRLGYAGARGGKSIIPDEQTGGPGGLVLLGTPDRVQNIDLPANALIVVAFEAMMRKPGQGTAAGGAAIFVGENQLKVANVGQAAPVESSAGIFAGGPTVYTPVVSCAAGLACDPNAAATYSGDVATGQALALAQPVTDPGGARLIGPGGATGGLCHIFGLPAGTYEVSVRFGRIGAGTSGSITAKERKLWVWTKEFPTSGV